VVGVGAVVIDEGTPVAEVAEESAAPLADIGRSNDPAGCRRVEWPHLLERTVLVFGEELAPHVRGHRYRIVLGRMVLAPLPRLAIIADASTAFRALFRAVAEDVLARSLVEGDHVRLAARSLHLGERPQLAGLCFEFFLDGRPFETPVAVLVLLEPGPQGVE